MISFGIIDDMTLQELGRVHPVALLAVGPALGLSGLDNLRALYTVVSEL